jgi:hypothetical protein
LLKHLRAYQSLQTRLQSSPLPPSS